MVKDAKDAQDDGNATEDAGLPQRDSYGFLPQAPDTDAAPTKDQDGEDAERNWDKDRQARDQERANELKELKQKLDEREKTVNELISDRDQLQEQLDTMKAELSDLRKQRESSTGSDLQDDDLLDQDDEAALVKTIRDLANRIDMLEKQTIPQAVERARAQAREEAENAAALERVCARLDHEYGPQYRNEAIAKAKERFLEEGFTDDHLPSAKHAVEVLEQMYKELAGSKKPEASNKGAADLATGGGRGGGPVPASAKKGRLRDVIQDMQREGFFK